MTHCPDCRTPIHSMMMLDARNVPEYYCECCAQGFPVAEKTAQMSPEPVLA